ncbi:MAG TPA: IclR family transcriptional regulator [Solirubrobacteraceae bacterium]|jgi:DNA-binding IclR family transcriptional regulator|nr:IclR family transcriptional regulator [Solirubrobacteraceae bacterium]
MTSDASARPAPDPTAARAAHVLAAVLERSPRTVTELAEVVGLLAVDVAPLVAGLQSRDLVAWDAEGVRPGPAALRFARSGIGREDLVELAQPSMRRLATESGETANLILPCPAGTEAIAQVDGRHLLGATNWIGRELGLHTTAAGKVFLAFGAAELPEGELEPVTPATITDRERLRRELEAVRDQGYATIVDELEPGLSAVAAPVRDRGGAVIAALTASGASLRLAPQRLRLLGRVCLEQAHALSTRLGHDAPLDEYLATKGSQAHANTTVPLP